jgi:hypothetical protein
MAAGAARPIMMAMNSAQKIRRYVLVGRCDERAGVRRLSLARLVGVMEIASTSSESAKSGTTG